MQIGVRITRITEAVEILESPESLNAVKYEKHQKHRNHGIPVHKANFPRNYGIFKANPPSNEQKEIENEPTPA